jgi:hypothetical protein
MFCPIKMWSKFDHQAESISGVLCDGPECAWYVRHNDQSYCAFTFIATRLANIEVILGRKYRK